jgi:cytochrome c oxidase subunit I
MVATLRKPGLLRGGEFLLLGAAFSFGLSVLIRALYGHDNYTHFIDADSILQIGLLAAPLFFLVGLGAFVYWFYWASGRPTRPEVHSSDGARSW